MAVEIMSKEVYVAAVRGNIEFLQQTQNDAFLLTKTYQNNTIIHIAVQHEQYEFIQQSLDRFPQNQLICEKNSSGNTALHVAAEVGNLRIVTLLCEYCAQYDDDNKPWKLKNLKGNTPIHVAIMHHNVKIATFLLEIDSTLACIVNDSKEAPLHLAIKHHINCLESEFVTRKIKQPIEMGGAALNTNYVPGENMSSMIKLLIEEGSCVACWADAKGMTPLHAAALLDIPYKLEVIRYILYHCPQSAEVFDKDGKSILHLLISKIPSYQEGINLLKFKEIYALRNHQDHQGDTPLHLAARNMDIHMVRVLFESSTNISIKNMEGISVASFIQQQKNFIEMLRKRKMTWAESKAANKGNITSLRERMSKLGHLDFLHSQDSQGKNMLHKLMQININTYINVDDFVDFIQQVVHSLPGLICQIDQFGDTPIHVLVRNHLDMKIYIEKSSSNFYGGDDSDTEHKNTDNSKYSCIPLWRSNLLPVLLELCINIQGTTIRPWLVRNSKGNTPLHEAIMAKNNNMVQQLLHLDSKSAGLRNIRKQTPLHLLGIYYTTYSEPVNTKTIKLIVEEKAQAALWTDEDGLTPLLAAIQAGNLCMARLLCNVAAQSLKITDANGQTFWHLLVNHPSSYYVYLLLKTPNTRDQLGSKDKNGNTMLHLAIEANRFDIVITFYQVWEEERKLLKCKGEWLVDLFKIKNKAGMSPSDLMGESKSLNTDNEIFVEHKLEKLCMRSVWGIPTIHVKNYVSTMGVVAALITTITFTAAFTVPGGLFQDRGTPIFLKKTSFQVFMISDMVAMCLSMMVLFCLLWIMVGGKRQNSLMLLDFSVTLLVASFFATLLTFMTGLFAVMVPIKPWIAYANLGLCSLFLVLCSLPLLIVHKFAIIKSLIPLRIIAAGFFSWTWARFGDKLCSASLCMRKWREQGGRSAHRRHRSFIDNV